MHCVLILGSAITEEVHISVGLKAWPMVGSKEKETKKKKLPRFSPSLVSSKFDREPVFLSLLDFYACLHHGLLASAPLLKPENFGKGFG